MDNTDEDIAVFYRRARRITPLPVIPMAASPSITRDLDDTTPDGGTDDDDTEGDLPKPLSDGADRLFNIEVLRFADGDVALYATGA